MAMAVPDRIGRRRALLTAAAAAALGLGAGNATSVALAATAAAAEAEEAGSAGAEAPPPVDARRRRRRRAGDGGGTLGATTGAAAIDRRSGERRRLDDFRPDLFSDLAAPGGGSADGTADGSPSATACDDVPNWTDLLGDGCSYYATVQICRAEGGPSSDGGRGPATEACCACGGGTKSTVQVADFSDVAAPGGGSPPSPAAATAAKLTTVATCDDVPNWTDLLGDGCSYYANVQICRAEGGPSSDGGRGPATEACCACGGGTKSTVQVAITPPPSPPTSPPTPEPTKQPTNEPTTAEPTTTSAPTSSPSSHPSASFDPTAEPTSGPTASPTTYPPTSNPTLKAWDATPGHEKFCGPKLVGGYAKAVERCSFATQCGEKTVQGQYGSSGNDCPKGQICFGPVDCSSPSSKPSATPSFEPTTSGEPTRVESASPSASPTRSAWPTCVGCTKPTRSPIAFPTVSPKPSATPTERRPPTVPPANVQNLITTRGSFCGTSYEEALASCAPDRTCDAADDCDVDGGEECYVNVSCTFHAREDEVGYVGKDAHLNPPEDISEGNEDDVYEAEFEGVGAADAGVEYAPSGASFGRRSGWVVGAAAAIVAAMAWRV